MQPFAQSSDPPAPARPVPPQAYNSTLGGNMQRGFVECLAASQSPSSKEWFQGTADAVRQYMWLFEEAVRDGVEDFLILSGAWCAAPAGWRALLLGEMGFSLCCCCLTASAVVAIA